MFVMIVGEISVFVCNKLHVNATVGAVPTLIYNTQPREQGSTSLTLDAISFHMVSRASSSHEIHLHNGKLLSASRSGVSRPGVHAGNREADAE